MLQNLVFICCKQLANNNNETSTMKSEMKVTALRAEFVDSRNVIFAATVETPDQTFEAIKTNTSSYDVYTPELLERFNKFITETHAEAHAEQLSVFRVVERRGFYSFEIRPVFKETPFYKSLDKALRHEFGYHLHPRGLFSVPKPEVAHAPWADVAEARIEGWNDGLQSRSRHSRLLIYDRAQIIEFQGKAIPGVVAIKSESYTKNGKWSNTSYSLVVAAGWKISPITQSWGLGYYVDDVSSMKAIKEQLGLDSSLSNAVVEEYLKRHLYKTYVRLQNYRRQLAEIEAVEEKLGVEFAPYAYTRKRITKRAGDNRLVVDGEVWNYEETPHVKIKSHQTFSGHGGGSDEYELLIRNDLEVFEVAEYDAYGDESLESLGYTYVDGRWTSPAQKEAAEEQAAADAPPAPLEDTPWAALKDLDLS